VTQRLPLISALLSHPGAAEALLPVLRALPAHRAEVSALAYRWPGFDESVPVGPGPLLRGLFPGAGAPADVLLIHADPGHALPGWAERFVAGARERGSRIVAVQRGPFYGPPPPPSVDPDLLLASADQAESGNDCDGSAADRPLWDTLAIWGPAYRRFLPRGARHTLSGAPFLEAMDGARSTGGDPRRSTRHAARMEVARITGLHPSAVPALIAVKLHGHWWPAERVAALLGGIVEGIRERGMHPIVLAHPADGADAQSLYREVLEGAKIERPVILSQRHWRQIEQVEWLSGVGAVITQGGAEGVLAAALGTPALCVCPPDTPYWPDPLVVAGGPYRAVRDPLAYVREGVAKGLEALAGGPHDPTAFREQSCRADNAADQVARAALDLTHRRRKAKPTRMPAEAHAVSGPEAILQDA
jgi:hypothetical protein